MCDRTGEIGAKFTAQISFQWTNSFSFLKKKTKMIERKNGIFSDEIFNIFKMMLAANK